MDFINNIKENTIMIVPSNLKNKLIKEKEKFSVLIDIKFMDLNEFISRYLFKTDDRTILYLMKKLNIKYNVAKVYVNNLIYIDESHKLYGLKKELDDNGYLYYDSIFKSGIKNYNIVVFGYDYIPKFYLNILNKFSANIITKEYRSFKHKIIELDTMDEEIEYVAYKICELIESGIDVNDIKLANVDDNYKTSLKRIFGYYNIPIELNDDTLYDTKMGIDFLNSIDSDIKTTFSKIEEKYDLDKQENNEIYNQIIDVINNFYWVNDYLEIKECLKEKFKNTKLKHNRLKNKVEVIDIKDNVVDDNEYVFLMSFNQNIFPKIYKDEEYLSDLDKVKLGLETSNEMNKITNDMYKNIMGNIKNLFITYKNHDYYEDFYISSLNYLLEYEVEKSSIDFNKSYSKEMNRIKLAKELDNLIRYNVVSDILPILYHNIDTNYLDYNNDFTGVDSTKLKEYIGKLRLSYSSLSNYYKCPFRFYISNVLKLDNYVTAFEAFVGSVFHNVLSNVLDKEFDFDVEYNNAIEEELSKLNKREVQLELTSENLFYLDKLKEDLKFIVDTIKKQYENMSFDKALYEKYIEIKKNKDIPVIFNGFVDKILTLDKDNKYIAIIDYKTGREEINLNKIEFGLNMQLPIYLYLVKNYAPLKDALVTGFYLQKILPEDVAISKTKTYEELKEDALKLEGYSNKNFDILKNIDKNYTDSKVVKSLKVKNDGNFYSYSKVLSTDDMDKLSKYVEKKIDDAIDNILNANFKIEPKEIDDKNEGCKFCKFKDICYMKNENVNSLKTSDTLEFINDCKN